MQEERMSVESMKQILSRVTNETKIIVLGDIDTNALPQAKNGLEKVLEQQRNSQRD